MSRRHVPQSMARRIAGWLLIGLALLGFILPVLPGLVFLALGIVLIGRHDPLLRRIAVSARLLLRRWSQAKQQHLRQIGRFARHRYSDTRRLIRAHLHNHERGATSWRAHMVLLMATLLGMVAAVSAMVVVWRTVF